MRLSGPAVRGSRLISPECKAPATETGNNAKNASPTPTIMDFVLADTRHYQGNTDAPITIVELSDFK